MQDTIDRCLGWVAQYNPLSVAKGALIQADNCVVQRENIVENRRGHGPYGTLSNVVKNFLIYSNKVLAHNNTALSYDDGAGTFADYSGSFSAPTSYKMRGVQTNSNLMITTSTGVKVLTDVAGTAARNTGAPRGLGPEYALNAASTGFLDNNYQCAYRVVIQRTDANSNVLVGYPSQRLWVTNSSGNAKNVDLTVYLPSECIIGDVIQVYRTEKVSGVSTDSSGDEAGLVYQYELASGDISAGYISFTDIVVDSLIGATIYTAPSQEGIAAANQRPPLAKDIALYKSAFMFYANTETKQRLAFSLLGTSTLGVAITGDTTDTSTTVTNLSDTSKLYAGMKVTGSGIPSSTTIVSINTGAGTMVISNAATATDTTVALTCVTPHTITLAGTSYSFADTESPTTGVIGVSVTGVAAADIDLTARSLIKAINRYSSNTSVYAYYLSGPDDLPGQILVEERSVGGAAFTLQLSDSEIEGIMFPDPPVSPATTTKSTSSNSIEKNMLYYSKGNQSEHVPLLNKLPVGASNTEILRIAPLRDSMIIIKEEGVFRLTGEDPLSFNVNPLDLTVKCKAVESVAILANQVFMLSNQGVVAISDTGVQVVSRDIEPKLLPLLTFSNLATYTYGCAYESDRTYLLSTITESTDSAPNQTLVYNVFTRAWTRYTFGFVAAIIEPGVDKLFLAKPADVDVYRERKDFLDTDYADPELSITITAISGREITFTLSGDAPEEGWEISQGGTGIRIASFVTNASSYTATVASDPPEAWTTGAATLYPGVGMEIEWAPWTGNEPGILKQVHACQIYNDPISGNSSARSIITTFRTNFDPDEEEVEVESQSSGWGDAWGESSWGGAGGSGFPTFVPMNKQYCGLFFPGVKFKNANERCAIAACSFTFNYADGRGAGR